VNERRLDKVVDVVELSKTVSDADIALFGLISRDDAFVPEDPPPPLREERRVAPYPLLASLLATAAASHPASDSAQSGFLREHIEFSAPLFTNDTLHMTVRVTAYDEAGRTVGISVDCRNQDQQHVAHGDFTLEVTADEQP
jgi:acyl dehydratase